MNPSLKGNFGVSTSAHTITLRFGMQCSEFQNFITLRYTKSYRLQDYMIGQADLFLRKSCSWFWLWWLSLNCISWSLSLQQHDDLGALTQQWTSQVTKPILQNGKLRWWSRIAILLYHWYSPLQIWSCLVGEKMKRLENPLTFPLKKYCGLIVPG